MASKIGEIKQLCKFSVRELLYSKNINDARTRDIVILTMLINVVSGITTGFEFSNERFPKDVQKLIDTTQTEWQSAIRGIVSRHHQ